MNSEKFKIYLFDTVKLLKEQALEAKKEADNPKAAFKDYYLGMIMGYYSIITLLKHQAFIFCIDQKELKLADIKPDVDLLDLHRNPDIDFIEDNWAIDVITEEKAKGYIIDTITLLKEQAMEAKKEAVNPKEGYEDYNKGELMAYYKSFFTIKNQASLFNLDLVELGLSGMDLDRDLVV